MDVIGPSEVFREHVEPRIVAPAAELLLAALPELVDGCRLLEVSAGLGTLSRALVAHLSTTGAGAELLVIAREDLAAWGDAPASVRFVRAGSERLPVTDGQFDVALGNLPLGARAYDAARVSAVRRALTRDGVFLFTTLLAGSFDEVLDVLTEVSEHVSDPRLRAAVNDARQELYREDEVRALLDEEGFVVERYGEEERALWYGSGRAAAADPLLTGALLEGWLGVAGDERLRAEVARFLDTYFEGDRFAVRVRTAVVRARRAR